METATGRVNSVRDGIATVSVEQTVSCPRCASGRGCGAGLMSGDHEPRQIAVRVPAGMVLVDGDDVHLAVAPRQLLRAAFLAYGVPLLAIVVAVGVGVISGLASTDPRAIGFAIAGLVFGIYLSRRQLAADTACRQFQPVIEGRQARAPGDG